MPSSAEHQARLAAGEFRRQHRLGEQPLGDLVALIEQTTGHDVAVLDADADEHGLTMRDPARGRAFIGVARSRNPMRQRSTLAHELGHLIFEDQSEDLGLRSQEEIRADAFARHLLVPVQGVRDLLGSVDDASERELSTVVERFLVSPALAAIAMRDAGYITPAVASDWMKSLHTPQLATKFGWSDFYATLQDDADRLRAPQGLVTRAISGYAAGVVGAQTIATLRGVPVETVEAELAEVGIRPAAPDTSEFELDELPDVDVDLSGLDGDDSSS